eukprot:1707658-Pyramimonas_sp.AAC.1
MAHRLSHMWTRPQGSFPWWQRARRTRPRSLAQGPTAQRAKADAAGHTHRRARRRLRAHARG